MGEQQWPAPGGDAGSAAPSQPPRIGPPAFPPPGPARRQGFGWLVFGVGMTVVVMVALVVAIVTVVVIRSDDDVDGAAVGRLMAMADDLEQALLEERVVANATILGQEQVIDLPAENNDEARAATDAALADYERAVADQDDEVRPRLDAALDALGGLAALRTDVDSQPSPGNLAGTELAQDVFDRYGEVIDAVLGGNRDVLVTVSDDPDVVDGVGLLEQARWPVREIPRITMTVLAPRPMPGMVDDEETLTDVATFASELTSARVAVMEVADGTRYESLVGDLDADLEEAGLEAVLDDAMAGGSMDVPALLEATSAALDAWSTFSNRVEARVLVAAGLP